MKIILILTTSLLVTAATWLQLTGKITSPEVKCIIGDQLINGQEVEKEPGMTYGNKKTYSTPGTLADIEGNVYKTVVIGNQEWMAENLRVTRYNNGNPIATGLSDSEWNNTTSGAYAIYPHRYIDGLDADSEVLEVYGALYNWYVVETGNICPAGWRVPSNEEWNILENYLIDSGYNYDGTTSGNKLGKSLASDIYWLYSSNTGVTGNTDYPEKRNMTGFTALPGGARRHYGRYSHIGEYGFFWSSVEAPPSAITNYAWNRYIGYNNTAVTQGYSFKRNAFSVRCLRD